VEDVTEPSVSHETSMPQQEMQATDNAPEIQMNTDVTIRFDTLLPMPKRERVSSSRSRRKPPSNELTSDKSMEFVHEAALRCKPKAKTKKPRSNTGKSESPKDKGKKIKKCSRKLVVKT